MTKRETHKPEDFVGLDLIMYCYLVSDETLEKSVCGGVKRMLRTGRVATLAVVCMSLSCITSCTQPQPDLNAQNANSAPRAQTAAPLILPQGQSKPGLGGIKVGSRPMGATIMLISEDEGGGFGRPQVRGSTPTTITDVTPGKYTVHLELNGYKAFQKSIEVKADQTATVTADLKR